MDHTELTSIKRVPFDGKVWVLWKYQFTAYADGLGLGKFLLPPPAEQATPPAPDAGAAEVLTAAAAAAQAELDAAKDKRLRASLLLSLDNPVLANFIQVVDSTSTTYELWSALVSFYERQDVEFQYELREELYSQKLGEDEDVSSYTQRIQQVAVQLANIKDPVSDRDLRFAILKGLPWSYGHFKTAMQWVKDVTSQSLVTGLISHQATVRREQQQDQQRKGIHTARETQQDQQTRGVNMATHKRKFDSVTGPTSSRPPRKLCTHCNKPGHWKEGCWDIHPHLRDQYFAEKARKHGQLYPNASSGPRNSAHKPRVVLASAVL